MKYLFITMSLITIVGLIGGCGSEEEESVVDYYPLAVGNIWDYLLTVTHPDSTQPYTRDVRMEIVGVTTLVNGTEVFIQETVVSMNGMIDTNTYYIAETDTAILRYHDVNDTTYPYKLLELPIIEGNYWDAGYGQTAVVLGRNNVSVPAGDYNDCWEVAYIAGIDTLYDYYAGHTGVVKEWLIAHEEGGVFTAVWELESATVQ